MKEFEILITSPPDRENLVAEIWHNEILVAEINQETDNLEIEFYLNEKIAFELDDFLITLKIAKRKIKEK
jgi:hypothetical protein